MDITVDTTPPEKFRTGVLVLGALADGQLPPAAWAVDEAAKGKLSTVIARGDLDAAAGASVLLHDVPGTAAERVLRVSLGKRDALGDRAFRDALGSVARTLAGGAAGDAAVALGSLELPGRTPASAGMNRPPAAASKMVTLTTSPIPNLISGGGR